MIDEIVQAATTHGIDAASKLLHDAADTTAVVKACNDAVLRIYWDHKNAALSGRLAQAGIELGLEAARNAPEDTRTELLLAVKPLAYNAGSFGWPGWDEPGIDVSSETQAAGYEAARLNLWLARDLKRGDLACSRACWLVGAHELAARKSVEAEAAFAEAAMLARRAGDPSAEALADGFACIAALSTEPHRAGTRAQLDAIKSRLPEMNEGPEFVKQLETAERLYLSGV
jgi:hypothetical protein